MADPVQGGREARQPKALEHARDSGLLATLEQWAKHMTAPLWWDEHGPAGVRRWGGTLCLVHTGERLLGVSAAHVHTTLVAALSEGRADGCQVGAARFDPMAALLDIDERRDLVSYRLSEIQAHGMDADIHRPRAWPPQLLEHAAYFVCGWPSELQERGEGTRTHYFAHYIARLSDRSRDAIVIALNPATSRPWGAARIPPGANLGGMSGGPVYVFDERGLATLTLVGVVSEYADLFDGVRAVPLSIMRADGTIVLA